MSEQIPPDCFDLEAIQKLQSYEGRLLTDVNYYLWVNQPEDDTPPYRFLYALECLFEGTDPLVISTDEDSTALQLPTTEALIKTVEGLHPLHGNISLFKLSAVAYPLWESAVGKVLEAVRLTRQDDGFYLNDALLLDFDDPAILVRVSLKEGVEVLPY